MNIDITTLYIDYIKHIIMYYNKSNIDCILKYMNSANIWIQHINGSPGRHVNLHAKVVWLAVLFSNSKHLFV